MKQLVYLVLILSIGLNMSCGEDEKTDFDSTIDKEVISKEPYNAFISNDSNFVLFGVPSNLVPDSSIYLFDTSKNELLLELDSVIIRLKTDEFGIVSGQVDLDGGDRLIVREHLLRFAHEAFFDDAFDTYILPWHDRPLFEILVFPTEQGLRLELLLRQHV